MVQKMKSLLWMVSIIVIDIKEILDDVEMALTDTVLLTQMIGRIAIPLEGSRYQYYAFPDPFPPCYYLDNSVHNAMTPCCSS